MGSVSLRQVRKSFGIVEVLKGVSLEVAEGEFVALVGASGCGKSTLLRMIAGLEAVTGGEIAIAGRVVNDLAPKERDIAMVFQNYALYPNMTVEENMAFSMRLRNAPMSERAAAVAKAAETLNLGPLLKRYPRELSGGQRQRVAMGRAIVRDPAVFLFDEPLSNLDAKLRVHMRSEIKALHQRLGTTMIYVTHDQVEAMTMADRIVVMNGGVIEQADAPLAVYDRPQNIYVAGFIGSPAMNLLHGTVAQGPDGARVDVAPGLWVPLPAGSPVTQGRKIVAGIRPENLLLSLDLGAGDPQGVVMLVEPSGSETLFTVQAAGQVLLAETRQRLDLRPGMSAGLNVAATDVHLFDPATGSRLG
jgi:multiple sugar transport system ATP-binding protein